MIFLHGRGDTGQGWSPIFADEVPLDYFKPEILVTLNLGMRMPAWFDLYSITPDAEEDEDIIDISTKMRHSMIDEEVRSGIPSHRIVIGGFSMDGSLSSYAGLIDKPLAGVLGLSSFLVQKSKVPGELADVRAFLAERLPKI